MLISLRNVSLQFGINPILDNINLNIDSNEKIALIGRNGAGKSSLLKVINNNLLIDSGNIEHNTSIKIGMLDQDFSKISEKLIYNIIADGLDGEKSSLIKNYRFLSDKIYNNENYINNPELLGKLHEVQERIDHLNIWDSYNRIDTIVSKLHIDQYKNFQELSGGQKRRVLLAKSLVSHPDLLLLDEPTNHLDLDSIKWLENLLSNWKTSLLFISHDRSFIKNIATRIIELDRGQLLDWPGNYDNFLRKKQEYLKNEEIDNIKFDKKLAEEEKWIRQGIKARRTRNEGRVRALKEMRKLRSDRINLKGNVKLDSHNINNSGSKVIEAKNISHGYTDTLLINDLSLLLMRGDKVAIIGPNGCGKTTLINILLNKTQSNNGSVEHGTQLEIAYFDQLREELDLGLSVRDNVSGGSNTVNINGKDKHIVGYLQDFLFTPDQINSNISVLSGGEKNRLLLAKLFTKSSNFLILDEPTNDLDIETLELLEELLVNYKGTILLISHDREFIDNIATSVLVFEEDGKIDEYVGGYSDYEINNSKKNIKSKSKVKSNYKSKSVDANKVINNSKGDSTTNQQDLKKITNKIEKLEKKIEDLNSVMTKAGFYDKPKKETDDLLSKSSSYQKELEDLYAKWENLE